MGFGNAPPTVDAAMTPVGGAAVAGGRSGGWTAVRDVGAVGRDVGAVWRAAKVSEARWLWMVWAI